MCNNADDIAGQLEKTTLSDGPPLSTKKKPAGTAGYGTVVQTNLAPIEVRRGLIFFKYDVIITIVIRRRNGDTVEKEVTRPTINDTHSQQRKNAAVWVYQRAIEADPSYFDGPTAYDRAKILFSMRELQPKTFEIAPSTDVRFSFYPGALSYTMVIKPCTSNFKISCNDLSNIVDERVNGKVLLEVLNLLCSQKPFMETDTFCSFGSTHYLLNPAHYRRELPPLPNGKYMAIGANKKVAVLEGEQKTPTAYVTTEVKKTNFHDDDMPLFLKLGSYKQGQDNGMPNYEAMNRNKAFFIHFLKNLEVYPVYEPEKVFPITGFSARDAEHTMFVSREGRTWSVCDYYRIFKNILLRFPKLFLVTTSLGGKDAFYPVEVLRIAKNQRVLQGQMTGEESLISIRASATLPKVRLQQTWQMKADLGLVPENQNLRRAGITVSRDLAKAPARQIVAPEMVYGHGSTVTSTDNAKWNPSRQQYISPAEVGKWVIIGLLNGRDENFELYRFAEVVAHQMMRCGMIVKQEPMIEKLGLNVKEIEGIFATCRHEKVNFMMFVSSDNTSFHADVKRLEAKYQIVTQDTKFSTVFKVCSQEGATQTLQGIVNKSNMKLGGVNYCVKINPKMITDSWLQERSRMIFGFEMTHPAPLSKSEEARGLKFTTPSVLGYACNSGDYYQSYIGDFRYVAPRSTDSMGQEIANIIPGAIRAARVYRPAPTDIVMYFHGVSECQYSEISTNYKRYIRQGLDQLSQNYCPNLTLIAVSRKQNERFYPEQINGDRAVHQNIAPGTVVDRVVVNPSVNEFYLMAHSAFQGTAKAIKYTVVEDTTNTMDAIQTGTHALCFLHEIVASSVSLPAPLLVADRCAKRGAMVFASHKGSISPTDGDLSLDRLNEELTNRGKILETVRFNA